MTLKKILSLMPRIFKMIAILIAVFYCSAVMIIAFHWGLDVCPLTFKKMGRSDFIPIVYELPTMDMYLKAKKDEVILGGCSIRPLKAVCRHCGWPVKFSLG